MLATTDFKIKTKVQASSTRNQAMSNSRSSVQSSEVTESDGDSVRSDSIARLVEGNKMRRLQEAKRNWALNHCENSPFRMNYSSMFSSHGSNNSLGSSQGINLTNVKSNLGGESPGVKSKFNKGSDLAAMTRGSKGVSNTPTSNFQTKKVN